MAHQFTNCRLTRSFRLTQFLFIILASLCADICLAQQPLLTDSLNPVVEQTELKTVKLYGAGGFAGLDAYQSGFFISKEGHILTVWSTVLDVDEVTAVCSDGSRFNAKVEGIDPNLEIAILKTDELPNAFFESGDTPKVTPGTRVLAFSNLFGIATGMEKSSVQRGVVMALTELNAGRGYTESVYQGPVYIIDAMTNNPGAAGGALTDWKGRLVGMLGKELRDNQANIWLNYAIPMDQLRKSIERIMSGGNVARKDENRTMADRPVELGKLGVILVPNILTKTPAYVDLIQPESTAYQAGLKADDLILFVNSARITSQSNLYKELQFIDVTDECVLLVQRGSELKEIDLTQ